VNSERSMNCSSLPNYAGELPAPPQVLNGTVILSAGEMASWGPWELNPYRQFFDRKPDDIIANSIPVFHGSFDISLAAAAAHAGQSRRFLMQNNIDKAFQEAQMAAELAPDSAEMQAVLCQALLKSQQPGLDLVCRKALEIAQRVYPEYQLNRMPAVMVVSKIYSQLKPK
jgi:hypothetical protein